MDEEQFLGIASPQERATYERLPPEARASFLATLPQAPRSTIATPEFQEYLTGQGDEARARFEGLSPEDQEEAARLILQRSNQPTDYVGLGARFEHPDIPFLTSAGTDAGFGVFDRDSMRIAAGNIFGATEQQRREIIARTRPDARFYRDRYGSTIVEFGDTGHRFYLGGPLDEATRLGGQAATFYGAGALARAPSYFGAGLLGAGAGAGVGAGLEALSDGNVGQGALTGGVIGALGGPLVRGLGSAVRGPGTGVFGRPMNRALATGTAEGAASVGMDVGAQALGSEQPADLVRAGLAALVGTTFEAITPAVMGTVNAFARRLAGSSTMADEVGNLAPDAVALLRRAGVDPSNVAPEMVRRFREFVDGGMDPEEGLGRAAAERFNIPLTRGEAMAPSDPRRFRTIQQESAAERSSIHGQSSQEAMQAFRRSQLSALEDSVGEIVEQVTGQPARASVDIGESISTGVRQTRDSAYQRVRDLYRQADDSGVTVNAAAFRGIGADGAERTYVDDIIDTAVEARDGVSFDPVGAAGRAISYLNRQFTGDRAIPLTEIERVRQGLQRIRREAQPHEQASIGDLVDAYDAFMEALPEEGITGGGEGSLALYREARDAYRDFRQRFTQAPTRSGATGRTATDFGGRTIENIANDSLGAPERVAGMVLGQGDQIGTRHTAAIINRMQQSLGADHTVFSDLRSEVLRRIFNRATADRVDHPAQFARRMTNEVDRAFSENPTVMEALFSEQERAVLRNYADAVRRIIPPDGAEFRTGAQGASALVDMTSNLLRLPLNVAGAGSGRFGEAALRAVNPGVRSVSPTGMGAYSGGAGLLSAPAVAAVTNPDDVEGLLGSAGGLLGRPDIPPLLQPTAPNTLLGQ